MMGTMDENILFIASDSGNFLVNSLISALRKESFNVTFCSASGALIADLPSRADYIEPQIILIFLEDIEGTFSDIFPVLKDMMKVAAEPKKLYLIGQPSEISHAKEYIEEGLITGIVERPVTSEKVIGLIRMNTLSYVITPSEKTYALDPSKKTLLIVDDDPVYLQALKSWFVKFYNVIAEGIGTDAISAAKQNHIDLMLLDYEMPLMSGLEVYKSLKQEPKTATIPVIFLTGNDSKDVVKEILIEKPVGYVLKTTPPMIIIQKVMNFLNPPKENYKKI